ncbi:prepilin peptidase [Kluyvera sichuanensis]|uniref:prepilin peptidase n=1 Tax=Kluyvera sichuanensis TaxID=2725494 RepID=UPI0039F52D46
MYYLFYYFLLLIISILLIYSCITDILYRQITNRCVLAVLVSSIGLAMLSGHINIIIPAIVLIIGFILTTAGMVGAGDIKLIVALLFSIPQNLLADFIFYVCCLGSPVSIMALVSFNLFLKKKFKTVPFGVAISIGYIFTIWHGGVI